ncbi:ATP-binding protein [Arenibaculum pallidiluteum]|uniref:ATP-binding protein n=1 Tax=Arenibaculum pallidiluteum TaxID=2812559 RepID=UPI001A97AB82|nr:ATP-binding protein [Arenibaculum pallidiluteum]
MARLGGNVSLPPELDEFIDSEIAAGRYTNRDEVLRAALCLLGRQGSAAKPGAPAGIGTPSAGAKAVPVDFQGSRAPMLLLGPGESILEANAAFLRLTGYSGESLPGRSIVELLPATLGEPETVIRPSGVPTGTGPVDVLQSLLCVDGGMIQVSLDRLEIPIGAAAGASALVLVRETASTTEVEDVLRRAARLHLALSAANAGVWDWDAAGGALTWSEGLYRLFGVDPVDFATPTDAWKHVMHPDDFDRVAGQFLEALRHDHPELQVEYRIMHPVKGMRWIMGLGRSTCDATGRPLRMTGLCIDVTERKLLEDAHRAAKEEAERANQSKSRFLAAASHDLRQPLQSAILFAGALARNMAGDPARAEQFQHLERSLDTLKGLLDALLDVSRLDAGVIEPTIEQFRISGLLDHIRAAYAHVAAARSLSWDVTGSGATVRSDPTLLGRMLRNLVENAFKYTERGGVELHCQESDGTLRLEVCDTGPGIPAYSLDAIFEEFHQLGNPERDRQHGLGLGLSIVRRLGILLEHRIDVRSEPGKGSVFSVDVPLAEAAEEEARPAPLQCSDAGRTVLVVDDDPSVLLGLEAILKDWGWRVVAVSSVEEALDRIGSDALPPDIVLADYRLRDERVGTDAILGIWNRLGRRLPSALLTGETGPECRRDAVAHGLDVLYKPVTPRQLDRLLVKMLKRDVRQA